jgi:hypothetical protein
MRLHEIEQTVDESVNYARYIDDAEDAMKKGILKAVDNLPHIEITPEMQADIDRTGELDGVKQTVNLAELIAKYCSASLKNLAKTKIQVSLSKVQFIALGNNEGECDRLTININSKYINSIAARIWFLWDQALEKKYAKYNNSEVSDYDDDEEDYNDYDYDNDEYNTDYPYNYKELADETITEFRKDIFTKVVQEYVDKCASIFIHELVHAKQHAVQLAKGIPAKNLDYRSYIKTKELPTKEKFQNMVATPDALDDPLNYKIYRASPQEMAAFANQAAAKFIKDNKLNVSGAKADAATMAKLQNYLGKYFKDRDNYKEYILLKRYGNLVYKAVADYLNRNAEQAKQNTR